MTDETPTPAETERLAELNARLRATTTLPWAASQAVHRLRFALDDLEVPRLTLLKKRSIASMIEIVTRDLEWGLENDKNAATGDLSKDLKRALPADITVGEIEGARLILQLLLAALPPEVQLREARS